jgi:hypothetical protein
VISWPTAVRAAASNCQPSPKPALPPERELYHQWTTKPERPAAALVRHARRLVARVAGTVSSLGWWRAGAVEAAVAAVLARSNPVPDCISPH